MGGLYTLMRDNFTQPASTDDILTVIPASSRQFELVEISIGGMGTASAANSTAVLKSSGGTTGGGALTVRAHRQSQAAFAGTNFTTWSAQPSADADACVLVPWNANGGLYRWVRIPGDNIIFIAGDTKPQMSIRGKTGTSSMSLHVMVEEF